MREKHVLSIFFNDPSVVPGQCLGRAGPLAHPPTLAFFPRRLDFLSSRDTCQKEEKDPKVLLNRRTTLKMAEKCHKWTHKWAKMG